ncbi:hypothetical protein HCN44_002520 [Aphidius gifuensis]|uniref:Phosphatidic acid phosphatase type 2/haloperoxidase domain-containing protein n=1 Tax=Aphidius gifuensis TaxID=684658 RepID=A0A835CV53_APHGI|nr:phospholipid phosphatase 5 [Aphidius gifuensis]KAF7996874.1 hypothetical protein HCN44_002520 [Aphidius gifuensis]
MVRLKNISIGFWFDILLRIFLALLFVKLEKTEPFTRKIDNDELWLYKYPRTESYVPTSILWPLVFLTPILVISLVFIKNKNTNDFSQAMMSVTLALGLNGTITNIIKIIVGRPRPDFYWRCFPDGLENSDFTCTGNSDLIRDGKKSFPSGHSSFAFASFGFITLYLAGKLQTFGIKGKGNSWKLCLFIIPLIIALGIALSRTCDYHHHWQDVAVGSFIGFTLSYICYRHYYPPLVSQMSYKPYSSLFKKDEIESTKEQINGFNLYRNY